MVLSAPRERKGQPQRRLGPGLCDDSRMERERSAGAELLSMMALVAAVVAIVILFFFGVGYLFGRMFL